ncbi:hypothetical protein [Staphylococcus schleiferi]|uniref:Uncharacterized protein n=1 Tax=Staphylococcus schleiferi TaxID=1295 RepID=A0A7Z7QPS2_STASC|nr:hypothetical protein [Staphylococcus schleiferi]CAD7359854.1 Uncharacterised protein [Staphylococcus schleiferi]SUM89057.1 Uncharacterised protein [Staphylococcus schleiferi]
MPAKIEKNTVEEGLLRKKVEFSANQSRILKAGARFNTDTRKKYAQK